MLSNAYFLAKFRFDTAENEPAKNLQNFAKFANFADPNPLTLIRGARRDASGTVAGPRRSSAKRVRCCGLTTSSARGERRRSGDVRERRLAKFRQNVARFRLYRLRFLQENMRFAAFFKIYQIL